MDDRKLLGKIGEDLAVSYLFAEGYAILDRNFRSHSGEIDIVCEKNGTVYFVEVKTRTCDVKKIDAEISFKVIEVMIRETDDSFTGM